MHVATLDFDLWIIYLYALPSTSLVSSPTLMIEISQFCCNSYKVKNISLIEITSGYRVNVSYISGVNVFRISTSFGFVQWKI